MRKVIFFNLISLDGYFAGPNGEIDWHRVDPEFNQLAVDQLNAAGGLVFGRITYEVMADYWPTPLAIQTDPVVAALINNLPKYVFSRSLKRVEWANTTLIHGDAARELARLKQTPGGDLYIFGSADLTATFLRARLVDEIRVILNPILLGKGLPLFPSLEDRLSLQFLENRTLQNGNILLAYRPPD